MGCLWRKFGIAQHRIGIMDCKSSRLSCDTSYGYYSFMIKDIRCLQWYMIIIRVSLSIESYHDTNAPYAIPSIIKPYKPAPSFDEFSHRLKEYERVALQIQTKWTIPVGIQTFISSLQLDQIETGPILQSIGSQSARAPSFIVTSSSEAGKLANKLESVHPPFCQCPPLILIARRFEDFSAPLKRKSMLSNLVTIPSIMYLCSWRGCPNPPRLNIISVCPFAMYHSSSISTLS
mmetsp:Transcript_56222/g.168321  ORF Transcript_56222/g.168321 Transcript_56222/m.168321 type:complete len:233 (-) Transcript_56222:1003-1701(-)